MRTWLPLRAGSVPPSAFASVSALERTASNCASATGQWWSWSAAQTTRPPRAASWCGWLMSMPITPKRSRPERQRHPAGFSISGASVGTFLRSALLIAGLKALGKRFGGSEFYERAEKDLAFGIMRSQFHHGYPKGVHCCVQCTLAVIPVLDAGAIRYFDCHELSRSVRRLVRQRQWRFAKPVDPRIVRWALGDQAVG
jgi:hypothetical protein